MPSKADLWMPLYFGDYLSDTMHLTTEQHGAYLLLLMAMWKRGGQLPNDNLQLAAIAKLTPVKWKVARAILDPFLSVQGDQVTQKRLSIELAAAKGRSVTASENGALGGRPKKAKDNPTDNLNESGTKAEHNPQESSSPSPSPTALPAPPPTQPPPSKTVPARPADAPTGAVWAAYEGAYQTRYQVNPVRNAKVNGMLYSLLKRLAVDEAPSVAAFYVGHNRGLYVSAKHAVDLLLRDCEGLRTEWASGRSVTDTEARQVDKTQSNFNAFAPLIAEAQERERKLSNGDQ